MREPFILYRRPDGAKGGRMFYVAFWDETAGDYVSRRSVGSLVRELATRIPAADSPTSQAGARAIAEEWLRTHAPGRRRTEELVPYLEAFWGDDGAYARAKAAMETPLSKQYLYNMRLYARVHIKPFLEDLGRPVKVDQVTVALLEDLRDSLYEDGELSNRSINQILQSISVPLGEEARLGRLRDNPCRKVRRLPERKLRRKPFSIEETRAFFALEWADPRLEGINVLAATTGMRLGECRGLLVEDVRGDSIHVCHNWQDREGLKQPKWNEVRDVPLPAKVRKALLELGKRNPWGDGFVFHGASKGRPIDKKLVEDGYASALEALDISPEAREERALDFHAWRHFFNSNLRGHVDDAALRALTGHRSEEMTNHYYEVTPEQRRAVGALAAKLLA